MLSRRGEGAWCKPHVINYCSCTLVGVFSPWTQSLHLVFPSFRSIFSSVGSPLHAESVCRQLLDFWALFVFQLSFSVHPSGTDCTLTLGHCLSVACLGPRIPSRLLLVAIRFRSSFAFRPSYRCIRAKEDISRPSPFSPGTGAIFAAWRSCDPPSLARSASSAPYVYAPRIWPSCRSSAPW